MRKNELKRIRNRQDTEKSLDNMKVLWLANIPSPYRVDFFNELGKKCNLTVLFERKASKERDDNWKTYNFEHFTGVFLHGMSIGVAEALCPGIIKYINKSYDYIIVTTYSDPTGIIAISYMKWRRIPYLIEGDGAFPGCGRTLKEELKRWVVSGAEICFSTGKNHDSYYKQYGSKKIIRYPFTSVFEKDILPRPFSYEEKTKLRKTLGMKEKSIVLAVGQFIYRKGYDILLKSASLLSKDIGIYIVGGDAPVEYIEEKEKTCLDNVHFVSFKNKQEIKKYYSAADVFVHPTREDIWGLVINEAMAHALPVVSTEKCNAAIELVTDGENGMIIPAENAESLKEAIVICLSDKNMPKNSLKTIQSYTIEQMADTHYRALGDML